MKVEQSSDLRAEWSSEMGVERSSDSKSGVGQSSDLGVGWNLEQQKCEMGCPLTVRIKGNCLVILFMNWECHDCRYLGVDSSLK